MSQHDPDPRDTPGLEPGGGVPPGETPPGEAGTAGLSHREPPPPKRAHYVWITLVVLAGVLIALFVLGEAVGLLHHL